MDDTTRLQRTIRRCAALVVVAVGLAGLPAPPVLVVPLTVILPVAYLLYSIVHTSPERFREEA